MALTNIEYGSLASSEIMNNNFSYLDNKIAEVSDSIMTNISSMLSNIATINSRLSEIAEEIQENNEDINYEIEKTQQMVNTVSMVPNWKGCQSIVNSLDLYLAKSNGYLLLIPVSTSKGELTVNGVSVVMKVRTSSYENAAELMVIPVKENDVVSSTVTFANAYFLPAASISSDSV